MPHSEDLRIDAGRLWASLEDMASIGPGRAGGSNRQALTDADAQGRRQFATWCEQAGLTVGVDEVGNMFARREGTDPAALPMCVGSHLDTQETGGKYDGVLGVLAGLELVRTLNDAQIYTRRPIVVANWTNEEGGRFPPAMLGSGVYAGVHDVAFARACVDSSGRTFGEELDRIGWRGDEPAGAQPMHAYFELHIEQGPILEAQQTDIGVVTHNQGFFWLEVTLTGRSCHTGSTPMPMRANANLAMARILEMVQQVAMEHQPDAVGGVGQIQIRPNSRNVIPAQVVLTVDLRSPDAKKLDRMRAIVESRAVEIAAALGVGCSIALIGQFAPIAYDHVLVSMIRKVTSRLGYSHMDIVSGAGHDACWTAQGAPSAMIMCPCVGGLSHNEAEAISRDWAEAGANVLLHTVLEAAGR